MNRDGEPTNLLNTFDDAVDTATAASPPPAFGPKPKGKTNSRKCPSHFAFSVSQFAFRISHFTFFFLMSFLFNMLQGNRERQSG